MIEITLLKIIFALCIWVMCVFVGYVLTETKLRIAQIKAFDFAPFNCCKCFTFWLTVCASIISVFVLNMTLSGIIIAILAILTAISMQIKENKLIGD